MPGEDSPTKYERIADDLRADIRGGRYAPGSVLPSKAALRDRYDVSDGPVNKALDLLRAEGLVETRQGTGSFVCDPLPEAGVSEFTQIMQRLDEMEAQFKRQAERIDDLAEQIQRLREQ